MDRTLLDTGTLSEILKRRDPVVAQRAAEYLAELDTFTFSEFTWFEVRRGLLEKNAQQQLKQFEEFTGHCDVLPVDRSVYERAAELWSQARLTGHPHSDADILIAATALVHGLTLGTGNARHFDWIEELVLTDWRRGDDG